MEFPKDIYSVIWFEVAKQRFTYRWLVGSNYSWFPFLFCLIAAKQLVFWCIPAPWSPIIPKQFIARLLTKKSGVLQAVNETSITTFGT